MAVGEEGGFGVEMSKEGGGGNEGWVYDCIGILERATGRMILFYNSFNKASIRTAASPFPSTPAADIGVSIHPILPSIPPHHPNSPPPPSSHDAPPQTNVSPSPPTPHAPSPPDAHSPLPPSPHDNSHIAPRVSSPFRGRRRCRLRFWRRWWGAGTGSRCCRHRRAVGGGGFRGG